MSDPETFVRVQATYRGRLGVEVGVFVAVDHLRRAGALTADEESTYLDVDDWFNEHLPNPDFYADGNAVGAVTWFKSPVPDAMGERVDQLCAILRAHGVPFDVVRTTDPGARVYEDAFQIGVVPYERQLPTPMPDGVVQAPTSAGSKRAVAASTIRHVLFDAALVARQPSSETAALVRALRRNGYGVRSYSHELGVAKPDPAFFVEAARRIGAEPQEILFVDDTLASVEGASRAGLRALQWTAGAGHTALLEGFARHGVDARLTADPADPAGAGADSRGA